MSSFFTINYNVSWHWHWSIFKIFNFSDKGNVRVWLLTFTRFVPISITTAPGFSQLPRTMLGIPTSETTMSAWEIISSGFLVYGCTVQTVAWCLCPPTIHHIHEHRIFYINKISTDYLQQKRNRQSNDLASPDHHRFFSNDFHAKPKQQLKVTLRGTRDE